MSGVHDAEVASPPPRPPGTVVAAVAITSLSATATLVCTVVVVPLVLWLGDPVFDTFDSGDRMRWSVVLSSLAVIAMCTAADYLAVEVYRGHLWARNALAGMAAIAAAVSAFGTFLVVPVAVIVACLAVVVLLCVQDSRAWFRPMPAPF